VLVEWLVDEAETLGQILVSDEDLAREVRQLCRRARAIAHFVRLWTLDNLPGAAAQLAAVERFIGPCPMAPLTPGC